MLQKPLEQPDSEPMSDFKTLRTEVIDAIYAETHHDVVDDVISDLEEQLPEILLAWAKTRILTVAHGDQLALGEYLDEVIERTVNENCFLCSQ